MLWVHIAYKLLVSSLIQAGTIDHMLKGKSCLDLNELLAFTTNQYWLQETPGQLVNGQLSIWPSLGWSSCMKKLFLPDSFFIAFLTDFSHPAFMVTLQGILMSLKMTDCSFISCFVSCFDNTGYRIMCPPISAAGSHKKKKWGSWQRHWLKSTLKGEHILNKEFDYGMEGKLRSES